MKLNSLMFFFSQPHQNRTWTSSCSTRCPQLWGGCLVFFSPVLGREWEGLRNRLYRWGPLEGGMWSSGSSGIFSGFPRELLVGSHSSMPWCKPAGIHLRFSLSQDWIHNIVNVLADDYQGVPSVCDHNYSLRSQVFLFILCFLPWRH